MAGGVPCGQDEAGLELLRGSLHLLFIQPTKRTEFTAAPAEGLTSLALSVPGTVSLRKE